MFMHVPGIKVVAPSNAYDAKGCLIAAIRDDNPVMFVEHRLLYSTRAGAGGDLRGRVRQGPRRAPRRGRDHRRHLQHGDRVPAGAELLADVGISAEVIDPDLADAARHRHHREVRPSGPGGCSWSTTPGRNCGASAEIVARVAEAAGARKLGIAAQRMGFAPTTCPTTPALESEFYPEPANIAAAAPCAWPGRRQRWTPDADSAELGYQVQFRGPF